MCLRANVVDNAIKPPHVHIRTGTGVSMYSRYTLQIHHLRNIVISKLNTAHFSCDDGIGMTLQTATLTVFMPSMSPVMVRTRPVAIVLFLAVSTHTHLSGDGLLSADTAILDPSE